MTGAQVAVVVFAFTFAVCSVYCSHLLHKVGQQGNGQLDKYEWED